LLLLIRTMQKMIS